MSILTPDQIDALMRIIRDASTAVAIRTTGHEVPAAERKRLAAQGWLPEQGQLSFNFVTNSFEYGQVMAVAGSTDGMSYDEFQRWLKDNPVALSPEEQHTMAAASARAGQYCVGLGNRYQAELGNVVATEDVEWAQKVRGMIRDETAQKVEKRKTVGALRTKLGQLTQDWSRDWERIAITESQMAHQEGLLEATVERFGGGEKMAKVPEPDACEHCFKHYTENGKPRVETADWWMSQGPSNAGRKAKDWKPVLGAMHPHCRCQLVRVPEGWGFDEGWDLVPLDEDELGKADFAYSAKSSLEKARKRKVPANQMGFDFSGGARAGGPYIGPRGGKWADPAHTIPWKDPEPRKKSARELEDERIDALAGELWDFGRSERAWVSAGKLVQDAHDALLEISDIAADKGKRINRKALKDKLQDIMDGFEASMPPRRVAKIGGAEIETIATTVFEHAAEEVHRAVEWRQRLLEEEKDSAYVRKTLSEGNGLGIRTPAADAFREAARPSFKDRRRRDREQAEKEFQKDRDRMMLHLKDISRLPETHQKLLDQSGVRVRFLAADATKYGPCGSVAHATRSGRTAHHLVVMGPETLMGHTARAEKGMTLVHELGHILDRVISMSARSAGGASQTADKVVAMIKEQLGPEGRAQLSERMHDKEKFRNWQVSPQEWFAEAYRYVYRDGGEMKTTLKSGDFDHVAFRAMVDGMISEAAEKGYKDVAVIKRKVREQARRLEKKPEPKEPSKSPAAVLRSEIKDIEKEFRAYFDQPVETYAQKSEQLQEALAYVNHLSEHLLHRRGLWGLTEKSEAYGRSPKLILEKVLKAKAELQENLYKLYNKVSMMESQASYHRENARLARQNALNYNEQKTMERLRDDYGGGDWDDWEKLAASETPGWETDELNKRIANVTKAVRKIAKLSEDYPGVKIIQPFEQDAQVGRMKIVARDRDSYIRSQSYRRFPALMNDDERAGSHVPASMAKIIAGAKLAQEALEKRGLGHLWQGQLDIGPRGKKGQVYVESTGEWRDVTAAASYTYATDRVAYNQGADAATAAQSMLHELGHRYWFKNMTEAERNRFRSEFGKVKAVSDYGSTNPEEDFAEVFMAYVAAPHRGLSGGDYWRGTNINGRTQIERLKRYLHKSMDEDELEKSGPYIGPKGGKWADPKHTIPWKEHTVGDKHNVTMHGKIFGSERKETFRVTAVADGQVKLSKYEDSGYGPVMPAASVKHFVNDLAGKVDLPPSGHAEIDAVINGKAEFLGKGDDGLAFRVGDKVVKVSTTVPYQPENPGHRSPEQAIEMLRSQAEIGNKLADMGIKGVQRSEFVVHGDKGFQIKDWVEIPDKLTRAQLDRAQEIMLDIHAKGYAIKDQIQVGLDKDGQVMMFDIGKAGKQSDATGIYADVQVDHDAMKRLYQDNGETYVRMGVSEGEEYLSTVKESWDKWIGSKNERKLKMAERHLGVAVKKLKREAEATLSGDKLAKRLKEIDDDTEIMRMELEWAAEDAAKVEKGAEILVGGEGDNKPDADFDEDDLAEGTRHELEHVRDDAKGRAVAKEIAKDHLTEDKDYYRKLSQIEKSRKLHYRTTFQGFDISIENRKGSIRRWYDPQTDTEGETKMLYPYGYIRLTEGTDGDHVDCFIGPHEDATHVYVVHQLKAPHFRSFDEDKCMMGFRSAEEAKRAYLAHYDRPDFFGSMTRLPVAEFRRKVYARKRKMIKSGKRNNKQLSLFDRSRNSGTHSAPDHSAIWAKAVAAVGIPLEKFALVVKHAREGHAQARAALDRVQELVKAEAQGMGYPLYPYSHDREVGTMGNYGSPARTAGDNVKRGKKDKQRTHKVAEARDDWPPQNREKHIRHKREDLPDPRERYDVKGVSQDGGWDREYNLDEVVTTTRIKVPLKRTIARANLERQHKARIDLRRTSKLSDVEIHRS